MLHSNGISRRTVLEWAAVGGLAMTAGACPVLAQAAKRIERLDPALDAIISTSEPIRVLAEGYGGDRGQAEGPVWWKDKDGGYLLFSDINNNRRIKYAPGQGATVFRENTNRANGLTRDQQGRLVICEADAQRVTRLEADGSITVIANNYQGKRLGRPNDVIVKSDGSIYFTDPQGGASGFPWEVSGPGVYRVAPDLGSIMLIADDFLVPNGLAFSPDESVLYIDDTRRHHIRAFGLLPNGAIAKETSRVFADLSGPEPGVPDGMKVDSAGNVFCGGSGGLYVMDKTGKKLGRIVHGGMNTTNMAFGGDDWKTLYFTSRNFLGSVNVKIPGLPVPAHKA
ncbi:MAG TPA: SMP-30/gluconolactonase/LRE family protein [Micropepsaceae bacterium]|nr:SMP-30/gluconolactonase/LRE family protein [Micropepsaceae bacterium]